MLGRHRWIVLFGIAALAAPRTARAGIELSPRVSVGVAVSDATRFELGVRSDLLYVHPSGLGLGLTGEVRSVSFSQRAEELGVAIALLPNEGGGIAMGPMLDASYGTQGTRGYASERLSWQLRGRFGTDRLAYAATSAIFVGARQTVSGPGGTEAIIGIEIGGGLIASWILLANAIAGSG